jgi:ABC-type transport system involved in multi-copper enzyme maturation permease subunit
MAMTRARAIGQVARRELAARWILGPAAVVVGSLTMIVIRSLDLGRGDADAVLLGTWLGTLVVAGLIGLSLLGDELSNGRLSFYFTRPFAASAIFGGKLAAGVLLALVVQGLLLAPVAVGMPALAWQGSELALGGTALLIVDVFLSACAAVALGMAAGVVVRAKTRWLAVDLAGIALVGLVAAFVAVHVEGVASSLGVDTDQAAYASAVALLQLAALVVAIGGLAYATATALVRGRTDRERAHAALSRSLWPILVPASGVLLAATFAWL